jgi:hypothetical protein
MPLDLEEIASRSLRALTPLLLDQARWHGAKPLKVLSDIQFLARTPN